MNLSYKILLFFLLISSSLWARELSLYKDESKEITFNDNIVAVYSNSDTQSLDFSYTGKILRVKNTKLHHKKIVVLSVVLSSGTLKNVKIQGNKTSLLLSGEKIGFLNSRKDGDYTSLRFQLNYGNELERERLKDFNPSYNIILNTKNKKNELEIRHWGILNDKSRRKTNRPNFNAQYRYRFTKDKLLTATYNRAFGSLNRFFSPIGGTVLRESFQLNYNSPNLFLETLVDRDEQNELEYFEGYQNYKALYQKDGKLLGLMYEFDEEGLVKNYLLNGALTFKNRLTISAAVNINENNREDNISEYVENLSYSLNMFYSVRKNIGELFIRNIFLGRREVLNPSYTLNDVFVLPEIGNQFYIEMAYRQLSYRFRYSNFSREDLYRENVSNNFAFSLNKNESILFDLDIFRQEFFENNNLTDTLSGRTYSVGYRNQIRETLTYLISYRNQMSERELTKFEQKIESLRNSLIYTIPKYRLQLSLINNLNLNSDNEGELFDSNRFRVSKALGKTFNLSYLYGTGNNFNNLRKYNNHTLNLQKNFGKRTNLTMTLSRRDQEGRDSNSLFSIGFTSFFETDKSVFRLLDRASVDLKFYFDKNLNNKKDDDEQYLDGIELELGSNSDKRRYFKSSKEGTNFSNLKNDYYNLTLVNTGYKILDNSYMDLTKTNSLELEVPLAKFKEIQVSSKDINRKKNISEVSYILSCKSIGFRKDYKSFTTLILDVPDEKDCFIEVNYFNFPAKPINFEISKKIVFNEKGTTEINFNFDLEENTKVLLYRDRNKTNEYDIGEELRRRTVYYKGKKTKLKNGILFLNLDEGEVFKSSYLKVPGYTCKENLYFRAEKDFFDKQLFLSCNRKK